MKTPQPVETPSAEDIEKRTIVRLSTAGSVDDGKSTLIGRLLLDLNAVHEDTLVSLGKASKKYGSETLSLALVTDGLKAEQEQGITIDVAYRYFTTKRRRFILADSPGHEQYTRNMATAAPTADLTIILIDATKGVLPQTKRHAFVASLMGVPRLLIAINKMDLVGFSEEKFREIKEEFSAFADKLGVKDLRFVPICARDGDNVTVTSKSMPWFHGETVLEYLENVYVGGDRNLVDFRFPVQTILRDAGTYRGYAGQIASGSIHVGEEILVLPTLKRSRVKSITGKALGKQLQAAQTPESVVLTLEDEIDISRGIMFVRPQNAPQLKNHFEAMVVWMAEKPLDPAKQYFVRHTTNEVKVFIDTVTYRIDVETLKRLPAAGLNLNDIGRVSFTASKPLPLDTYKNNRMTGSFIVVDSESFATVACGVVIDRMPEEMRSKTHPSPNLHQELSLVSVDERQAKQNVAPVTIWLTGLSGSGKSSIAKAAERMLFDRGVPVYRLDGDNLRSGLNKNLGFSAEDRSENLRRAAEVAKLMNEAGLVILASFITPREADRTVVTEILGKDRVIHAYISTPLEVCEKRDPHGLYKKSRAGLIREFTGVSSPFEEPVSPDLKIDTTRLSVEACAELVVQKVLENSTKYGKEVPR